MFRTIRNLWKLAKLANKIDIQVDDHNVYINAHGKVLSVNADAVEVYGSRGFNVNMCALKDSEIDLDKLLIYKLNMGLITDEFQNMLKSAVDKWLYNTNYEKVECNALLNHYVTTIMFNYLGIIDATLLYDNGLIELADRVEMIMKQSNIIDNCFKALKDDHDIDVISHSGNKFICDELSINLKDKTFTILHDDLPDIHSPLEIK